MDARVSGGSQVTDGLGKSTKVSVLGHILLFLITACIYRFVKSGLACDPVKVTGGGLKLGRFHWRTLIRI